MFHAIIDVLNKIINTISYICILTYAGDSQEETADEKLKPEEFEEDVFEDKEEGRYRRYHHLVHNY